MWRQQLLTSTRLMAANLFHARLRAVVLLRWLRLHQTLVEVVYIVRRCLP